MGSYQKRGAISLIDTSWNVMGKEGYEAIAQAAEREPLSSLILYRALKWSLVQPIYSIYFRGRVEGQANVPRKGAFIAVSNHASNFDPPIVAIGMNRPVAFMAKEELFRVPVLKNIIRTYGAYPVQRGKSDRSAIRAALNALNNGWSVGIFIQGTRTKDGLVTKPKTGAALIAAKAQVPLLPVSLIGTENIFEGKSAIPRSVPITLRIGETIVPPPKKPSKTDLTEVTQLCAERINALRELGR